MNKKYLILILILFFPVLVFAQEYNLLEPSILPDEEPVQGFEQYASLIYNTALVAIVIISLLVFITGAVEYILSSIPNSKFQGKNKMLFAIGGLVLALSSWLILNTINPELLSFELSFRGQILTPREEVRPGTVQPDNFSSVSDTGSGEVIPENEYSVGYSSQDLTDFRDNLSDNNQISQIRVETEQRQAFFIDSEGNEVGVEINIGSNGTAPEGGGVRGDKRTPKGIFQIVEDHRSTPTGQAQFTTSGSTNLGAAFVNTSAEYRGQNRGIGFHGSQENGMRPTYGCIRMRNEDLETIAPFMLPGTEVVIQ